MTLSHLKEVFCILLVHLSHLWAMCQGGGWSGSFGPSSCGLVPWLVWDRWLIFALGLSGTSCKLVYPVLIYELILKPVHVTLRKESKTNA